MTLVAPPKRKGGGRVTPKGTRPGDLKTPTAPRDLGIGDGDGPRHAASASTRYTPPTPAAMKGMMPSPRWVPILMFALFGIGMLVIILYYLGWPLDRNNMQLVVGLALILGGLWTATKLR
jgi:hypothetical protein